MNKLFSKIKRRLKLKYHILFPQNKIQDAVVWGIEGLGYMGHTFTQALLLSPYSKIGAVASRSISKSKKFAKRYGLKLYFGKYECLHENPEIEIIYIATPLKCHYENIKSALNSGKNVLCEKPIVSSLNQYEELISIANRKNVKLIEGLWSNFLPTYNCASQWIQNDKIGKISEIRLDLSKNEWFNPADLRFQTGKYGGVLMDYGVYTLSFIVHFLKGEINILNVYKSENIDGIDTEWHIILGCQDIKCFISISSKYNGDKRAVIRGHKGSIEWTSPFNRTNSIKLFDVSNRLIDMYHCAYRSEGFEYEIENVYKILRGDEQIFTKSICNTRRTLSLIEKIQNFR